MSMMMVQLSTDEMPELADLIEQRRAFGLDTFDEWWQGVYRVVTGPSPEHGKLIAHLCVLLLPRAAARGLDVATPVNVGIDKRDARVPDIAVYSPDTERTSPAFLATAEMVIEIMSPGERRGEKLPFYAEWNVAEYVELDPAARTVTILANRNGQWTPVNASNVLELSIAELTELLRGN